MRVTNEHLKMLTSPDCVSEMCTVCSAYYFCREHGGSIELAADLLEARKLIKEMRELLQGLKYNYDPKIDELLDKSKDYI